MEFLIECLIELLFEGSLEISSNKKISKFIRYPLIILILLFFLSVIFLFFLVSYLLFKENIMLSLLFLIIGIVFLVFTIIKFKKLYFDKNKE